jgi:hypothetical protein
MIDPPLSEEQALKAEMVEELFIPCWRPRPMPQTISIILYFDVCEDTMGLRGAKAPLFS